jgi:hypothetical protein
VKSLHRHFKLEDFEKEKRLDGGASSSLPAVLVETIVETASSMEVEVYDVSVWYVATAGAVCVSWAMDANRVKKPRPAKTTAKLRKSLARLTENKEEPLLEKWIV